MKRGFASFGSVAALMTAMLGIAALTGCSSEEVQQEEGVISAPSPVTPPLRIISCTYPSILDKDKSAPALVFDAAAEVYGYGIGMRLDVSHYDSWYFYRAAGADPLCAWIPVYMGPRNPCADCTIPPPPPLPPDCPVRSPKSGACEILP